jgi:hypothetical protein
MAVSAFRDVEISASLEAQVMANVLESLLNRLAAVGDGELAPSCDGSHASARQQAVKDEN